MNLIDTINKLVLKTPTTKEELAEAVEKAAQLSYKKGEVEERKASAISRIGKEFAGTLTDLTKGYKSIVATIETWAKRNRDEFGDKQSIGVNGHELAFRKSPGKVVHEADDDDEIVQAIVDSGDEELIKSTIAIKPALDKKAIQAHLDQDSETGKKLAAFGLRVDRPETFSFKPARPKEDLTD